MGEYGLTYLEELQEAEAYQDFLMVELSKHGLFIQCFGSRYYQYNCGESIQGIEIKHDKKCEKTGNLYIEVAERRDPDKTDYVPGGIMRDDNTWLYIVGTDRTAFAMSKLHLRNIYDEAKAREAQGRSMKGIRLVETPTSKGMLVRLDVARQYLIVKEFRFEKPFRYES